MKSFKFRIWDKCREILLVNHSFNTISECNLLNDQFDRYIYQQFTGLLDKNGKEIYEGDFVRAYVPIGDGEWNFRVGQVRYSPLDAQYEVLDEEDIKANNIGGHLICGGEEVIGNIFENKELPKNSELLTEKALTK